MNYNYIRSEIGLTISLRAASARTACCGKHDTNINANISEKSIGLFSATVVFHFHHDQNCQNLRFLANRLSI